MAGAAEKARVLEARGVDGVDFPEKNLLTEK